MNKQLSLSLVIFLLSTFTSFSQTQGIAYTAVGKGVATTFVTDYHCLGINSSALGWGTGYENKRFTTGMSEFNLGIYSDSLNASKLKQLYRAIRQDVTGKNQDPALWDQQRQYAEEYVNSGVAIDFNYNWFGFAFQTKKFGGIAVNIRESYSWYSKLNRNMADLIFNGNTADYFDSLTVVFGSDTSMIANNTSISTDTLGNVIGGSANIPLGITKITEGTEIRFAWNRYYNVGYGKKLFGSDSTFALYGGIGGRYIQSMASFDMSSDGSSIRINSALSPGYDINYGSVGQNLQQSGGVPKSVGNGYGLDFSVSAVLMGKLRLAAAVNNIGSVTYTRNTYTVKDTLVANMTLAGMDNYNITNAVQQFLGQGGILNLEEQEKFKVNNAATYRFGASLELAKIARLGIDVVGPFNSENPGSLTNPIISVGGDIRPVKWMRISAGYLGGGIYKHNIPIGINFIFGNGSYEAGISSRDALTFFLDGSNSISTAFGFARVRF